jgi:hypothetical protein
VDRYGDELDADEDDDCDDEHEKDDDDYGGEHADRFEIGIGRRFGIRLVGHRENERRTRWRLIRSSRKLRNRPTNLAGVESSALGERSERRPLEVVGKSSFHNRQVLTTSSTRPDLGHVGRGRCWAWGLWEETAALETGIRCNGSADAGWRWKCPARQTTLGQKGRACS